MATTSPRRETIAALSDRFVVAWPICVTKNKNHPLRILQIHHAKKVDCDGVDQFLVTAKQFGIHDLNLGGLHLPVQFLVEFCRDNTHLESLEIYYTILSNAESMIFVPLQEAGPLDSSVIATLDVLGLDGVFFTNAAAATEWTVFMAQINVSLLVLGKVTARREERGVENFDWRFTERIFVSELTFPSTGKASRIETRMSYRTIPSCVGSRNGHSDRLNSLDRTGLFLYYRKAGFAGQHADSRRVPMEQSHTSHCGGTRDS